MNEWKYILAEDGRTPIAEPDVMKWAIWLEKANRRVGYDEIGSVKVSTVFLGLDHRWSPHSHEPPILWETMIFGATGELADYQERYTSYEDALAGHHVAVQEVRHAAEKGNLQEDNQ